MLHSNFEKLAAKELSKYIDPRHWDQNPDGSVDVEELEDQIINTVEDATEMDNMLGWAESREDTVSWLLFIIENTDELEWYDKEPDRGGTAFFDWAARALGRIGNVQAIEPLIGALYWDDNGAHYSGRRHTGWFSLSVSEALAEILLKFKEGIPVKYYDETIILVDTLIWLIRCAKGKSEEYEYVSEVFGMDTVTWSSEQITEHLENVWDGNDIENVFDEIVRLCDALKSISYLIDIGWDYDKEDNTVGLVGWDLELFPGDKNPDFDLKSFLKTIN